MVSIALQKNGLPVSKAFVNIILIILINLKLSHVHSGLTWQVASGPCLAMTACSRDLIVASTCNSCQDCRVFPDAFTGHKQTIDAEVYTMLIRTSCSLTIVSAFCFSSFCFASRTCEQKMEFSELHPSFYCHNEYQNGVAPHRRVSWKHCLFVRSLYAGLKPPGQEFASKMSRKVHLSQNALDHWAKVEGTFQLTSSLRWSLTLASLSLISLFWIGPFIMCSDTDDDDQQLTKGKNTLVRFCCVR